MASRLLDEGALGLFSGAKNPPKKLYYRGNLELLKRRKIAIIGSRKMNIYTKNCVLELAHVLKNAGVCVVSGGALGVDITAAKGSMPCTIGIFANGLGQIYPKNNETIIKELYQRALVLSENEDAYMPHGYDFLLRNRLIIALSECVIIAQAHLQSGSMQSARLARMMKKPIFVLPHRLGESEGTNWLLKEKRAELITDFREFAAKFGEPQEELGDDFLEFCKKGAGLEEALRIFGSRVYEYELEGKIAIEGLFIRLLR